MQKPFGEKLFDTSNYVFLSMVGLLALYPFWHTLILSISTAAEANRYGFTFWPAEISFTSYAAVFSDPNIITGYFNSIIRTVFGTLTTLGMTCLAAYPIARKELPFRKAIIFFVLFTMVFHGGIVPTYLLINSIGLLDNRLVYILPLMLTAFNIIVVKNFFQSIPESLTEAARLEGANEWTILWKIYVPLSKPVLMTVALWTAVLHWNNWFDGLIYITSNSKQVLQIFLQRIVIENNTEMIEAGLGDANLSDFTPETIKAATVIVTVLPMLIIYPFVQRYFVKGIMIGGVKE